MSNMRRNNFYFKSFQLVILSVLLTMMSACSYFPAIAPIDQNDSEERPPVHVEGYPVATFFPDLNIDFKEEKIVTEHATPPVKEEVNEGDQKSMRIALTFDDGPDLKYTPRILDILKEKNVKATFFVVGIQVNKYPEVVQRMEDEGHMIGNHSYSHPSFTKLTTEQLKQEIDETDEKIQAVIGYTPEIVRPPYGAINDEVRAELESYGKQVIIWNIDPRDWDGNSVEDMLDNILTNARDGGNILLHSFGSKHVENTVKLLPTAIERLEELGYIFVTIDEL